MSSALHNYKHKQVMNVGGPTRKDSLFLNPYMAKRTESTFLAPTKAFLQLSHDMAMLFAFCRLTFPPPPVPPFLLPQNLPPKDIARSELKLSHKVSPHKVIVQKGVKPSTKLIALFFVLTPRARLQIRSMI